MKITPISINNYKFQNSLRSNNYDAIAPSRDVVSFSSSQEEMVIEGIKNFHNDNSISPLLVEKETFVKMNEREFLNEVKKVPGFEWATHCFINEKCDYHDLKKTGVLTGKPQEKAMEIMDYFWGSLVKSATLQDDKTFVPNAIAVVSKDKKLANDFIDAAFFQTKASTVLMAVHEQPADEFMGRYGIRSMVDFEKLPKKYSTLEELQEVLYGTLEKAKQKFETSNVRTILHVEDIEPIFDKNAKTTNISCLKDILSDTWSDYHTTLVFGLTDKNNCDSGLVASHRVGALFDLDKEGITRTEIAKLNENRSVLEAPVDRLHSFLRGTYKKYLECNDKIKEKQEVCLREIERAKQSFGKKPLIGDVADKVKDVVDTNIKPSVPKKSPLIKLGGAGGGVGPIILLVALGAGACIAYKKYVKNKAEKIASQQNQQSQIVQQPVKNVEQATTTVPVSKTSNVFSEFQKIG